MLTQVFALALFRRRIVTMSSENRNDPIFGAKTVDLHSLSGHVSDWIFLSTFTSLNDNMLCVSSDYDWYLGVYVKKGSQRTSYSVPWKPQ
jgi:hypothetical protein